VTRTRPEAQADGARLLPQSRWASLVRAGYGVALICRPCRLLQARTGSTPSPLACAVCRVLGVRHLAQAIVCGALPTRWLIRAGAAADLLHAVSMLALAGKDDRLRPALLTDAAIAGGFAAAGEAMLRGDLAIRPALVRTRPAAR
jgi:hypothetical protein